MLKIIPVEEAVGLPLAHDITEIIPGKHKGPAFRRGHIVQTEDISRLLDVGKRHLYVMELAYLDTTPILGLSGCVLHDAFSAFDILLPRLLAGEKIIRAEIMTLGHGGLQKTHRH